MPLVKNARDRTVTGVFHMRFSVRGFAGCAGSRKPDALSSHRTSPLRRMPQSRGFMVGKRMTSRMVSELVSSMTQRSMPMPRPPVGGRPYSRALI